MISTIIWFYIVPACTGLSRCHVTCPFISVTLEVVGHVTAVRFCGSTEKRPLAAISIPL